jgi:hypothetical protein
LYLAAATKAGLHMGCWIEAGDPQNTSYMFITSAMKAALGGTILPEYFPYWFSDIWLAEVHHFAFGTRPPLINGLALGGRRGQTRGLRDLRMWMDLFTQTRVERIALAGKVAKAFPDKAGGDPKETMRLCQAWDADMRTKVAHFSKRFGDTKPAEAYYERARERALSMLNKVLTD